MKKIIGFGISAIAALSLASVAPQAQAATTGTTTLSSTIEKSIGITVTPNLALDFDAATLQSANYVATSAADAIQGTVNSNCNTMVQVASSASGTLKSKDIKLQITSPNANGVIQGQSGYESGLTAVSDGGLNLISYNHTSMTSDPFGLKVQVSNANEYTGSTTAYTNTLTFTATAQ